MKKLIYPLIALNFFTIFFVQCTTNKSKNKISSNKQNSISNYTPTVDSAILLMQQEEAERLKTATTLKFDKEEYDFGECTEGDVVKRTIEFTNTGKFPLVISQAFGSCGCTIPTYDKEPVQPGQKGKLNIEFNSNGKHGANTKSVTVIANTNPELSQVSFHINVNKKKEDKSWF